MTATFRVPARRRIDSSHRRILALKAWGSGSWSNDQFVLEEEIGSQRVSGWMVSDVLGVQPNSRRKSSFDGEFLHKGTTQTEKLVPYFGRCSTQLFLFNHLGGETSVLVEKRISDREFCFFLRELNLFHTLSIGG